MTINNPQVKRRDLLKAGVAASAAMTVGIPLSEVAKAAIQSSEGAIVWTKGVCRFCGTGCGLQVGVKDGRVVATKGDPDAPVNKGLNCIKGYFNAKILYGKDYFYEELLGLKFKISTFSFFQPNSLAAEILYSKVREYVGDTRDKVVFDLYSGTGTIAQILAPVAEKVVGVEIVGEAVEAARENAARNGLGNCEFLAGDVLKVVDELEEKPDLIVLAGFLVVIPAEMIAKYRNRMINIHPSLIPAFCGTGFYGLKVHEAALERGVKVVGATVHFVDEGTDTGPIILQKAVEVENGDTPEILQHRVMEQAEWKILPKAIDLIANGRVKVEGRRTVIED